MNDLLIKLFILSSLILLIKKSSKVKTFIGLSLIYLLVLYDNTIITGTIINQKPIFFILISLFIYLLIYSLKNKRLFNTKLFFLNEISIYVMTSYFLIFIIEIIRLIFSSDGGTGMEIVLTDISTKLLFLLLFIFLLSKNNIDNINKLFQKIIRPYVFICLFIIFSSITILFLTAINITDLSDWMVMPSWIDEQIHHRKKSFTLMHGTTYPGPFSFPYFLSLVWRYDMFDIFNFQGLFNIGGRLMGLSKEPHIACLFLSPSLFIVKYYIRKNLLKYVYLSYFLFFLSALSTTNIISFIIIFILIQIKLMVNKNTIKKRYIFFFISSIIVISYFLYINYQTILYFFDNIAMIGLVGTSGNTAITRLTSLILPSSILGEGFLVSNVKSTDLNQILVRDYGILPLLIFIIHYFLVFKYSLSYFFTNHTYNYFGLSVIYILIHGLKVFSDIPINFFYLFILFSFLFIIKNQSNVQKYNI